MPTHFHIWTPLATLHAPAKFDESWRLSDAAGLDELLAKTQPRACSSATITSA